MIPARQLSKTALPRAARASRQLPRRQLRFQSTTSSSSSGSSNSGGGSHFATGMAGGVAGAGLAYAIYSFTPAGQTASKLNKAAAEANKKYQAAAQKLQQATPDADQAVDSIKQFAYSYVAWIPGGRGYVDAAFRDWETVRENHKDEADKAVSDAYKQFQELSKAGLSLETASRAYDVLAELTRKVADLSGDALSDILDNHPQAKKKLGGAVDQLKDMSGSYGPEAKKQVDETWRQIKDVFAGGFTAANIDKARQLAEDKVQQLRKLGDEAWSKGLEEAKPLLDKSPKVKELVEDNADALRKGNAKELFDKVRAAAEAGAGDSSAKFDELKKYVDDAVAKAKTKGKDAAQDWGLEGWLEVIPQGSDILPKLRELGQVADKHMDEGEKLLRETVDELKQVLEKKSKRAQEIVEEAEKDTKKGAKESKESTESKGSKESK
ncbi:apolipoprotein/apolipophorin [Purpureocillium lavendulum]|uniref:Apolipoprotein/apolipophorin n=1 Tax=Purpureocillium lavendulum TaxID=1247861 RepID=A0AB34FL29_9HYPO|nr:apolipoprotein/apolipophorin [Purpureocillium lavendulum]